MTPLQELKQLMYEDARKKYPNFPENAIPKPNLWTTAKPERRELKRIKAYIDLKGGLAQITDSSAKRVDNTKHYVDSVGFHRVIGSVEYRKGNLMRGTSDITATINGVTYAIELKRIYKKGKDRQSAVQKEFETKITRAGGVYLIVHSFEDFHEKTQHLWTTT